MPIQIILYFVLLAVLSIFSYGFTDTNLHLSTNQLFVRLHQPLFNFVNHARPATTLTFFILLVILFGFYLYFLRNGETLFRRKKFFFLFLIFTGAILAFSFAAFTYDLFNYITTAKVLFGYHENPYIVMPIDIPNEPYLAFTRAANKLALYGPVWLVITAIPHYLGGGNVWRTIIAFKLMNAVAWLFMSYLIYRETKSVKNVLFFALNPLVLIEILVSGHNDIYMMLLALVGIMVWKRNGWKNKILGILSFVASWWIKGATVVLTPLFFFRKWSVEKTLTVSYWLLALVFFIATPIREELYPWYAVWLVSTAAFLPLKKHKFMIEFTLILSFALELRQLPYMWMGYYEGVGPALRLAFTVIPLAVYLGYVAVMKLTKRYA